MTVQWGYNRGTFDRGKMKQRDSRMPRAQGVVSARCAADVMSVLKRHPQGPTAGSQQRRGSNPDSGPFVPSPPFKATFPKPTEIRSFSLDPGRLPSSNHRKPALKSPSGPRHLCPHVTKNLEPVEASPPSGVNPTALHRARCRWETVPSTVTHRPTAPWEQGHGARPSLFPVRVIVFW